MTHAERAPELERIFSALSAVRVGAQPEEYEIHREIARALDAAGIEYIHECPLLPGRRIDFACGSVGVEVKKGRPNGPRLRAQLVRYLEHTRLTAVIVVVQRPCALPESLCGKPVRVLALNRLWGVALR